MEFFKKIRDGLMGVEYESEEEDFEYVDDYDDERGFVSGDQSGFYARSDRDEREDERPAKSKKKKDRGSFFSKEPARGKRSSRDYEQEYDPPRFQSSSRRSSPDSKVLSLPMANSYQGGAGSSQRIVVFSPETQEDARPVCDNLKNGVICVINLENLDNAVAQRITDFLSGACDALDGSIQRISNYIFLIAPYNIMITAQVREELRNNGMILPWVQAASRK